MFEYLVFMYLFLIFRADALQKNQDLEFERNRERFMFLKVRTTVQNVCNQLLTFIFLIIYSGEQKHLITC